MRLTRLALTNFRQHVDTVLDFRPGLTGIIGPNGSGKTTILEAIAWAIYGAPAARGVKETLRFNRAPGRAPVRVELEFSLGSERYRVVRTPRDAELYRDGRDEPIAGGVGEVTAQLTRRLGMSREEFFNTYFTDQKQLQFLAAMKPRERARFLSQVLGYERLKEAQALVRQNRNELKNQVELLRSTLGDGDEIRKRRGLAEGRVKEAQASVSEAERRQVDAAERLAEVEPIWTELQRARGRDAKLEADLRVAATQLDSVGRALEETDAELGQLGIVAAELDELKQEIQPLKELKAEAKELARLAEAESRRASLTAQLAEQRERVETMRGRAAELEKLGAGYDELLGEVGTRQAECAELESAREEVRTSWVRDRQDAHARIQLLRDQAADLKKQIQQLESAGPDGVCPTCQRSLGVEFGRVLDLVRSQYEETVQDGKWLRARLEQLDSEPAELAAVEERLAVAREHHERVGKELAMAESALSQVATLRSELDGEMERSRKLAGEFAALPEGYDTARHKRVTEGLERLGALETRATQLETRLEARNRLKVARAEAAEEAEQLRGRITELESTRADLGFSEKEFQAAQAGCESARHELQEADVTLATAKGELKAAREAADAAREAERDYREQSRLIREKETEHHRHNGLDGALTELREELNARVRPELSEIASVFLAELTDGRYNQIVLNEDLDLLVLDGGEEKPVISGGEEDLANLVLRLAISQMIADRAGQPLSLLVLDEVFGGLDEQRRESVIRLLQRLQDRFEQVILITHIESIREGMDQVIRVDFEERTGASIVSDQSPGVTGEDLQVEDLAALVSE